MKKLLILIIILIFLPITEGIGISYSKTGEIFFEPNKEIILDYQITDLKEGAEVEISLEGRIAEYSEIISKIKKTFKVKINFPEEIESGYHELLVRVSEKPKGNEGQFIVATSVRNRIKIWALDPGKLIRTTFTTTNLNINETTEFTINAKSYGEKTIEELYGEIEIYYEGGKIKTIETEKTNIKSKEEKTLKAEINSEGMVAGMYKAKAIIHWDGEETIKENQFKIGSLKAKINNYTQKITHANIAEIKVWIESEWNSDMEQIYVEAYIDGIKIGESLKHNLNKWDKKEVPIYLNLEDIIIGTHKIEFVLNYEEEQKFLNGEIIIEKPKKETNLVMVTLIAMIMILIISILLMFKLTLSLKKNSK